MTVHFQVAEMASGSYWHLAFLRWSLVAIFIWFAIQKFTPNAAEAIEPLIANSPLFGVRGEAKIELTTAAVLIIRLVIPIASALGAAMARATFLLTTSFARNRHFALQSPCPLWVKSRRSRCTKLCPLYPRKRTSRSFDQLVGAVLFGHAFAAIFRPLLSPRQIL